MFARFLALFGWAAFVAFGHLCAAPSDFAALFRDPPANASRPSVALGLDILRAGDAEARRQLASLCACGAGGVLVRAARGDEADWQTLARVAAACGDLGLELGFCDLAVPGEKTSRLRCLTWTARMSGTGESAVYRPADGYREIARLAVPIQNEVLAHQVVEWTSGAEPSGAWRIFRFGCVDENPPRVDGFDKLAVSRHINRLLVECQNRLSGTYGTTLLWYQASGPGRTELHWFDDLPDVFLRDSGLGLTRHLPVLAGVDVGGEKTAAYVRMHIAQAIREAWRERFAEKVDELVHEAGLEAGIALDEAPLEPEDVALHFRRVTLAPARSAEQRVRNVRAAGAARALGHRFVVGRLDLAHVTPTVAQPLLPFLGKHEVDWLFCDGANRLLLAWPDTVPADGEGYARMQSVCRYAHRCQAALQRGDAACDFLVWSDGLPKALAGYSCDYANRAVLAAASEGKGEIVLESGRRYRDLAVSADAVRDPADAGRVRQLAAAGVRVWLVARGASDEEDVFARLSTATGIRRFGAPDGGVGAPDFLWTADMAGVEVRFVHRRSAEEEIYFVANVGPSGGTATCSFRDAGRGVPSRWDPVGGEETEDVQAVRGADGRMAVTLFLGPHESCFVVFAR